MLSRKVLRIKVLKAIYSFSLAGYEKADQTERQLLRSIRQISDLYIYQISFILEITDFFGKSFENARQKYIPTDEELHPNEKFVGNRVIKSIENNGFYLHKVNELKINWHENIELVRKYCQIVKTDKNFVEYMSSGKSSFEEDRMIVMHLFKKYLADSQDLFLIYEEKNIHWANDIDIANHMVIKMLKSLGSNGGTDDPINFLENFANEAVDDEERIFVVELFRKTLLHSEEYDKLIEGKLENWEIDRIALMDIIILKMAICELLEFPSIPVKVSFNEYIEIAKIYSTPKSNLFVNGVLDKIVLELTENKKIRKTGRGLVS